MNQVEQEKKLNSKLPKLNRNFILLALTSVLFIFSFPPNLTGFFSFFAFVPAFFYLDKKPLSPFKGGFFCGAFATLCLLYWFYWTVSTFALAAFPYLGFYWGLIFFISVSIRKKLPQIGFFFFPFLWCSFDYLFEFGHLAFPWVKFGYSLSYYTNLIQISEFIGIQGITFWVLLINVFIYEIFKRYDTAESFKPQISVLAVLIFIPYTYGILKTKNPIFEEKVKVGIIQTNVDPFQKWGSKRYEQLRDVLNSYEELAPNCDVVITPETVMPFYLRSNPNAFKLVKMSVDEFQTPFVIGTPDSPIKGSDKHYNSVVFVKTDSTKVYNKIKLVPFGERVPFVDYFPSLENIDFGLGEGHFSRGEKIEIFNFAKDEEQLNFSTSICFESIFQELLSESVLQGSDFLVNITNDAWFGWTHEQYQHSQAKIFRAIENKRSLVRVGNGGFSMVISPFGEVLFKTKLNEKINSVVEVPIVKNDLTFFTKFGKYISQFFLIVTSLILILCLIFKPKKS